MASSPSPITLLHHFQVSLPPDSAPAAAAAAPLPLTFFDIVWLPTGPVERLLFYRFPHPTSHFLSHHLPLLTSSLSRALLLFYPLSGRVSPPRASSPDAKFQIRYSPGDSVPLDVAESSEDFDRISGDCPRAFRDLHSMVPRLPLADDGSIPLMALQITVFPNQGVALGVAVHHVACDDSSSIHFLKSWAAAATGGDSNEAPISPPLIDRTAIADPDRLYFKILAEMQALQSSVPPSSPPPGLPRELVIALFAIGQEQIDRLKRSAAARSGVPARVSTFIVACAFAWPCLVRAQARFYSTKKMAYLLFSVECRGRLNPPVQASYFGNCLRPCFVEVGVRDLLNGDGVFAAAEAIGKAIKGLEEGGVLKGAEGWLQKIISLVPERPISLAGSPRYRVYDVDFGWGKPMKVEMTSIEKTPGTISLAEDRQGGVEMGLVLPKPEMEAFGACFRDGLKLLL